MAAVRAYAIGGGLRCGDRHERLRESVCAHCIRTRARLLRGVQRIMPGIRCSAAADLSFGLGWGWNWTAIPGGIGMALAGLGIRWVVGLMDW
jgi:hypothetical protein